MKNVRYDNKEKKEMIFNDLNLIHPMYSKISPMKNKNLGHYINN